MIGYSYDRIDVQLLSIANDYDPGRTVEHLWFMVNGEWLMIMTQDERWNTYGSWFMINGSRFSKFGS